MNFSKLIFFDLLIDVIKFWKERSPHPSKLKISFFLSIPTLAGASILGIYNIFKESSAELNFLAIIAVIFSFIFSYISIAIFLRYIQKFTLNIFVIYRIIISLFILGLVYL